MTPLDRSTFESSAHPRVVNGGGNISGDVNDNGNISGDVNDNGNIRGDVNDNGKVSREVNDDTYAQRTTAESVDLFGGVYALKNERGSISPLVMVYFLVTLIVIFIGVNVSHTYLERRHLVFALEASLQRATQKIDDWRYYTGYVDRNTANFRSRGQTTFLPIDCDAAREVFSREFELQWRLTQKNNPPDVEIEGPNNLGKGVLSPSHTSREISSESSQNIFETSISERPRVTSFGCDGKTLRASAEVTVNLPFIISFAGVDFMSQSKQSESVEVGLIFGG